MKTKPHPLNIAGVKEVLNTENSLLSLWTSLPVTC